MEELSDFVSDGITLATPANINVGDNMTSATPTNTNVGDTIMTVATTDANASSTNIIDCEPSSRNEEIISTVAYGPRDPCRCLRIKVIKACKLNMTLEGSRLYAKIYLRFQHNSKTCIESAMTQHVVGTVEPVWNEEFVFKVDMSSLVMTLKVFDESRPAPESFLGKIQNRPIRTEEVIVEGVDPPESGITTCKLRASGRRPSQVITGKITFYVAFTEEAPVIPPLEHSSDKATSGDAENSGIDIAPPCELALPPDWVLRKTKNGAVFYCNTDKKESSWSHPLEEFPPDWERRITKEGRHFHYNSVMKITQWMSPNLRVFTDSYDTMMQVSPRQTETSEPCDAQGNSTSPPNALEKYGPLPSYWIKKLSRDNRPYYQNTNTGKTQWDDPRIAIHKRDAAELPRSATYKKKLKYFMSKIKPRHKIVTPQLTLSVARENIYEQSFRFILDQDPSYLRHRLWVDFIGEKGLDYGGPTKEWFMLISRQLFNPSYGLFEYSNEKNTTIQINPASHLIVQNHLEYFRFAGRITGMAAYHGANVDAYFIRPIYKLLLGNKITMNDLLAVDEVYHNALRSILAEDVTDMDLMFSVTTLELGNTVEYDIMENGRNIPVTNENKTLYTRCLLRWMFITRVAEQLRKFINGFKDVIELNRLKIFHPSELEFLICGLSTIDVKDWKSNTKYRGYSANSPVIHLFWQTVYTFTPELQSKLLQFVSGSSRLPMNGFSELMGSNGPQHFTIEKWGAPSNLPRAHTCFNRLDLPPYENAEVLREKLIMAMTNAEVYDGVD